MNWRARMMPRLRASRLRFACLRMYVLPLVMYLRQERRGKMRMEMGRRGGEKGGKGDNK